MEKKIFLHKSPSKSSFRHRIRAYARGSADIIYRIRRISLYLRVSYWGQKV